MRFHCFSWAGSFFTRVFKLNFLSWFESYLILSLESVGLKVSIQKPTWAVLFELLPICHTCIRFQEKLWIYRHIIQAIWLKQEYRALKIVLSIVSFRLLSYLWFVSVKSCKMSHQVFFRQVHIFHLWYTSDHFDEQEKIVLRRGLQSGHYGRKHRHCFLLNDNNISRIILAGSNVPSSWSKYQFWTEISGVIFSKFWKSYF